MCSNLEPLLGFRRTALGRFEVCCNQVKDASVKHLLDQTTASNFPESGLIDCCFPPKFHPFYVSPDNHPKRATTRVPSYFLRSIGQPSDAGTTHVLQTLEDAGTINLGPKR